MQSIVTEENKNISKLIYGMPPEQFFREIYDIRNLYYRKKVALNQWPKLPP